MFLIIQHVMFVAAGVAMLVGSAYGSVFFGLCGYVEQHWDVAQPENEAERAAWLEQRTKVQEDRKRASGVVQGCYATIFFSVLLGGGPVSMRILFLCGGFFNLMMVVVRTALHNRRKARRSASAQ